MLVSEGLVNRDFFFLIWSEYPLSRLVWVQRQSIAFLTGKYTSFLCTAHSQGLLLFKPVHMWWWVPQKCISCNSLRNHFNLKSEKPWQQVAVDMARWHSKLKSLDYSISGTSFTVIGNPRQSILLRNRQICLSLKKPPAALKALSGKPKASHYTVQTPASCPAWKPNM